MKVVCGELVYAAFTP
nr:hypothetical protein [Vibrio vulnificus]